MQCLTDGAFFEDSFGGYFGFFLFRLFFGIFGLSELHFAETWAGRAEWRCRALRRPGYVEGAVALPP